MTQPTFTLRVIAEITGQRSTLAATLASLADQHPRSAMAGRALSLQASPTSLGFIAAGLLEAVVSVLQRLSGVRETLSGEMGGAIGNLAVLTEIVRSRRPDVTQEATVAEVLRNFVQHLSLAAPDLSWHTHWMDDLP